VLEKCGTPDQIRDRGVHEMCKHEIGQEDNPCYAFCDDPMSKSVIRCETSDDDDEYIDVDWSDLLGN